MEGESCTPWKTSERITDALQKIRFDWDSEELLDMIHVGYVDYTRT